MQLWFGGYLLVPVYHPCDIPRGLSALWHKPARRIILFAASCTLYTQEAAEMGWGVPDSPLHPWVRLGFPGPPRYCLGDTETLKEPGWGGTARWGCNGG